MSDDTSGSSQTAGDEQDRQSQSEAFISPEDTQVTCDVLCSLSASYPQHSAAAEDSSVETVREKKKSKSCPKHHQLPLFLSSKYDDRFRSWSIQDPT